MSTENKTPALKSATDALKPHEPKLLDAFSRVFKRKRPPQSMRALAPLAMVFLLEAFGLSFLLNREAVRAAIRAARGPGKDEDDMLDDSDEMTAIRWAAARHDAVDRAYMATARELFKDRVVGRQCATLSTWLKDGYGPDRAEFDRQWGQRNPIDLATAPRCFDPSAQLSILDAVGQGDGYLGAFVSTSFLASSAPKQITCMNQALDLEDCETLDAAAARAVSNGWIAYLDHRGVVMGLRLIPRVDGVQTRLRAPIANIVAMYAPDKRDEQIAELETKIREHEELRKDLDRQWQDATGASDPEMARELTAQRIEQIKNCEQIIKEAGDILNNSELPPGLLVDRVEIAAKAYKPKSPADGLGAFVGRELVGGEYEQVIEHADGSTTIIIENSTGKHSPSKLEIVEASQGVGRMIWPDPDHSPDVIKCANAIVAHRRGEFVELEFPSTPKIFEQVRAWLMFYQMNICERTPDETGYSTNAIGTNGEIPPKWSTMKQAKRNSYPGFVLFAPDDSAKVVFCAREPSIGKVGKRKVKEPKS